MSKQPNKTSDFLAALKKPEPPPQAAPAKPPRRKPAKTMAAAPETATAPVEVEPTGKHHSRVGKKQICGFLDGPTLEILAVLRVRLQKDNSELITLALEELYRSHSAKRAFGDA